MTTNKNKTVLKPITFKALRALFGAAGKNNVRRFLDCLLVDYEHGNLAATNGHILAVISGCVVKTGNKKDNIMLPPYALKQFAEFHGVTSSSELLFSAPGHVLCFKKGAFRKGWALAKDINLLADVRSGYEGFTQYELVKAYPNYHRVMHVDTPRDEFSWLNPVYLYAWYEIAEALGWGGALPEVTPGGRTVEMDHFGTVTRLLLDTGYDSEFNTFDFYIMPIENEPSMIPVENGKTIEQEGK